ncbi:Rpn family recombination-promoting nuclease/putative transposase [Halomonas sp. NYA30]
MFPVVLHNGSKPWTAPLDIYEMVTPEPPGFLQVYQPHLRYYLVDEARYPNDELGLRQTPLSGVFSIEKASTDRQGLQQAVDRIVAIIQADPNKERIDKIITRWLKRHLQRLGADVNLDQLNSLVKDKGMLAENLENWAHKERQKVLQEAEKRAFESKRNAARKLIALTEINDQLIAEIEELPIEEVEKLRAETQH